jgi:hypothetical protein
MATPQPEDIQDQIKPIKHLLIVENLDYSSVDDVQRQSITNFNTPAVQSMVEVMRNAGF